MSTLELLDQLRARSVRLWVEGEDLRYNAPQGALTPALREELVKRKSDLIALFRSRPAEETGPRLEPQPRAGSLPLSFGQEQLWFLGHLEPESPAYNMPAVFRLTGLLDVTALEAALGALVGRHEALRTSFLLRDGAPVQVISAAPVPPLQMTDLSALTEAEQEAEVSRRVGDWAEQPFDLAAGPQLRAALLRLSSRHHVLMLNLNHILADAWSLGILVRDLASYYEAEFFGRAPQFPALPIQYGDFALWQRERLACGLLDSQFDFWRRRLADLPEDGGLFPDANPGSPPPPRWRGATHSIPLPEGLSAALRRLCRQERVSLFMSLLAVFQVLLARSSGRVDVVVGTPISGRTRPETEHVVGFFLNTLAMRADVSGNPSFKQFLASTREAVTDALTHQEFPFEKLVERLRLHRAPGQTPLFQELFVFQNAPPCPVLPGLETSPIAVDSRAAKFDLTLTVTEIAAGLNAAFEYRTAKFSPEDVARLSDRFLTLLEGVVSSPEQGVFDLPLLTEGERRWLCRRGPVLSDEPKSIPELFDAQADRTPDGMAIVQAGDHWTYLKLRRRADGLARHLRTLEVGPEDRVGICLPRRPELVAAMLGVLKAGAAYVPLDPAYPLPHLARCLHRAGSDLVLTHRALVDRLSSLAEELAGVRLILLDDEPTTETEPVVPPQSCPHPDHIAYIIPTSGSTGEFKLVAVTHRGASALLHWARRVYSPDELAGVLASSSISFDLSVFELFAPLTSGGTVILIDTILELPSLPLDRAVTLVNTVPSALAEVLRHCDLPGSVQTLNLAGEPLPLPLVERLYAHGTVRRVYNLYGPSEAATYSTFALIEPGASAVPIGTPIHGTRAYVLDERLELVPLGVPGELCLAGEGLARGYLGEPRLTAERFCPDPHGDVPGARLYRTGDRARLLPDGSFEFLGRHDGQIKLRGHRIELGAIEAVLDRFPGVRQSAVLAREGCSGLPQLVAYIVTEDGVPALVPDLRRFLNDHLPGYLIPDRFVSLSSLPLLPNGKLNRSALPLPEDSRPDLGYSPTPPKTTLECQIATIWREILDLDTIGVDDDFFALGGHSLLAVRLVDRISTELDVTLPVRTPFEQPTVAGLARVIEAERRRRDEEELDRLLAEVEGMSDDEVRRRLADDS